MIEINPNNRYTAEQAFQHDWFIKFSHYNIENSDIKSCLNNFKEFRNIGPMQKAFLIYMVTKLFTDHDNDFYKKIFYCLNKKCDGNLTRAEFLQAYWRVGIKSMSELQLDRVLSYVDSDENGFITFGEFIVASVSQKEILTKEKIHACFKSFDMDSS